MDEQRQSPIFFARRPAPPRYQMRLGARDTSGETLKIALLSIAITACILVAALPPLLKERAKLNAAQTPYAELASPDYPSVLADPPPTPYAPATPAPAQVAPRMPLSPSEEDYKRAAALQSYCYRMAAMNAQGEYPSLQRTACADYHGFATSKGIGIGPLPHVLEAVAPQGVSEPRRQTRRQSSPSETWECQSLQSLKDSINAKTRQAHSGEMGEYYRAELRRINARMWDLNCRNH